MGSSAADNDTKRIWIWIAAVIALSATWGNVHHVGRASPDAQSDLVTTTTLSIFGRWPYLVVDASGFDWHPSGLAAGVAISALIVGLACALGTRSSRSSSRATP